MTRPKLESYLKKCAVTEFDSLKTGTKPFNDIINFVAANNVRILRSCFAVGYASELPLNYGFWDSIRLTVNIIDSAYLKKDLIVPIIGASIWEIVTRDVDSIWMSDEVASKFNTVKRRFIFDSIKYVDDTSTLKARPDISRTETQMYFYYLATKFIDCGIEYLHMGILGYEDKNDAEHIYMWNLLSKIRQYSSTKNRGLVLLSADDTGTHYKNTDTALYDFNSNPTRVTGHYTGTDSTWVSMWNYMESDYGGPGFIEYNGCSPYGKMNGGYSCLGWYADTLPYLIAIDNTVTNNCNCIVDAGCWTVYGYDEISWFSLQSEGYRNKWLCYANSESKKLDKNSFFCIPVRTLFTRRWKYYNALNGYGFNQEDAITKIWNNEDIECNPNNIINLHSIWNKDDKNKIVVFQYPNPVQNTATIVFTAPEFEQVTLTITDIYGKIITLWNTHSSKGYVTWSIKGIADGVYICKATSENAGISIFKIVVAK